ncbi:MAG: hypothetical protein K6343_01585 [Caldisericaceae bacterium]
MVDKNLILKKVEEKGKEGITKSELRKKIKIKKEELEALVEALTKENKIIDKRGRLFAKSFEEKESAFVSLEELEKTKKEIFKEIDSLKGKIAELKNEIDRVYEYVDDVFLYLKKEKGITSQKPSIDDLLIIYDNLNATHNFGDSIPLPLFKDEILEKYNISENEIDELLLELDRKEIIYLQTLDNKNDFEDSNRGINYQGRLLYFITWMKRQF